MRSTSGSILLLAAISLCTLFFRLGSLPFVGNDEPRYARIAEEMHGSGSWITPTLQDSPWLEKPPLYYWATIPFYSIFQNREIAARIAPALCAFLSALAVFWLCSRLRDRLAGLIAGAVLITSLGFVAGGRTAATDMPFTCCLTIGLAILASAIPDNPGKMKVLPAYVFLGLAVLGKGPVALVLALGIGFLFWYLDEHGTIPSHWHLFTGIPVLLAISFPWFWLTYQENGFDFINTFIVNHNIARYFTEIHHHSQPFYYYVPVLLLFMFPWSGWLPFLFTASPFTAIRRWRDWDPAIIFLTCWFLFPLLFFSLSDSKLAGYILPSLPPLSMILGIRISQWMQSPVKNRVLKISMGMILTISFAMAIIAPIYFRAYYDGNWKAGLVLSPFLIIPALASAFFGFRGHCGKAVITTVLQGVLVVLTAVQFAVPTLGEYLSTKDIAGVTLKVRTPNEPIITYGIMDHTLDYYTGYRVLRKVDDPATLQDLLQKYRHMLVVTKEEKISLFNYIQSLSIEILATQGNFRLLRLSIVQPAESPTP